MRLAFFLTAAAVVAAGAQLGSMKAPPPAAAGVASSERSPVALQAIGTLEKEMDSRIAGTGAPDACVVLGGSRGLYINGFGAIFTGEVDLINSPGMIGLMQTTVSPDQKAAIRKRKQAHLPLLQQTMRDVLLSLAASPALKLADTDQVVIAVRLFYRPWEDTAGLPGQIVMRLDRRSGVPKMEIQ
jgi:hypothetical protein